MEMKLAVKAFSLSVKVWSLEFSKRASMAAATSAAREGSSMPTVNRCVCPIPRPGHPRLSDRYRKWKNIMFVSVPGYRTGSVS